MTEHWDAGERDREGTDWAALVERVREVAATAAEGGLARLRVSAGEIEVEIRRSPAPAIPAATVPELAGEPVVPASNGTAAGPLVDELTADVVGVFRLSRPAVTAGTAVAAGRELGAVESLGIRNPVVVRFPGTVAATYVDDGQPVDYGCPLFAIER